LGNTQSMAEKSRKAQRPPATGRDPVSAIQLPEELTRAIDRWAAERGVSRSEAISALLEQALATARPTTKGSRAKAAKLAAEEIDKISLAAGSDAERQRRKRRLLKGPGEFRDIRGDRSKR
jgi:Arc/MetJ-type ribon-helix-helix transcriptional regulator